MNVPAGLATDAEDSLLVCDADTNRNWVIRFDSTPDELDVTPDPDDEQIPEVPAVPRTRPGDIWALGPHRVGCGDGRAPEFLAAVIGEGPVDAAFLDPPYDPRSQRVKA